MLSIFPCVCWPLVGFGEMSVYVFCSFFYWVVCLVLSCMSCLCITEINPLLVVSFAIIFSHSELSFNLVYCFFCCANGFKSQLFTFIFISIPLGGESKRIFLWCMSKNVLSVFSSKSFIVSSLTFKSLIHFEFIFVFHVRKCSSFILLHAAVQFSHHH